MSVLNLQTNLSSYDSSGSGCAVTNNPSQINFKRSLVANNIVSDNVLSQSLEVAANSSATLFTGSDVRKFIYVETDSPLSLLINGTITIILNPFINGTTVSPGVFMMTCDITSLVVTNASMTDAADVFFAVAE